MDTRAPDRTRTRERRCLLGPDFLNGRRFLVLFRYVSIIGCFPNVQQRFVSQYMHHTSPYYTTQKLAKGNAGLGYTYHIWDALSCVFFLLDDIGDLTLHRFDSNSWTPTSKHRAEDIPSAICQTSHQVLQTLLHPGEWTLPNRSWWWGSDCVSNLRVA